MYAGNKSHLITDNNSDHDGDILIMGKNGKLHTIEISIKQLIQQ